MTCNFVTLITPRVLCKLIIVSIISFPITEICILLPQVDQAASNENLTIAGYYVANESISDLR